MENRPFLCVFKSAWIFACSLQITRNTLGCIFLAVLRFVFEKKRMQKTQVFTKRKTAKKNAAQCISSNLKATSKNSGTFENTQKRVDFPLSIVFDQVLQLLLILFFRGCGTRVPKWHKIPLIKIYPSPKICFLKLVHWMNTIKGLFWILAFDSLFNPCFCHCNQWPVIT